MSTLLNSKVAFLTGGSTGIGLECARAYAAEGAHVVLCARNRKQCIEAAHELAGDHYGIPCDVSVASDVERAIAFTLEKFGRAAYTATKGAMNTLTKSRALDYAADGIRVNAVCPAGTWTPMLRTWTSSQPDPESIHCYLDDIHPLGYCPEGDVIVDACVFLISNKARFITGHIMHVSGGAEISYKR